MKAPKFALDVLFYPEVSVNSNPDYDAESEESPSEPKARVFINKKDDRTFQVGVGVIVPKEVNSDQCSVDVLGIGVFSFSPDLSEEEKTQILVSNGPNLVYGGIREMVAMISGRGPWGEYYLPARVFEPTDFDFGSSKNEDDE